MPQTRRQPMPCEPSVATEPSTTLVHLDQLRARRLEVHVEDVRTRLHALERTRVQAELRSGSLWRELSALQRELRGCRERLARSLNATDPVTEAGL